MAIEVGKYVKLLADAGEAKANQEGYVDLMDEDPEYAIVRIGSRRFRQPKANLEVRPPPDR